VALGLRFNLPNVMVDRLGGAMFRKESKGTTGVEVDEVKKTCFRRSELR